MRCSPVEKGKTMPNKEEFFEIKSICDRYGCGNVMEWASALHRRMLTEDGLPASHAFVSIVPVLWEHGLELGEPTRNLYDGLVSHFLDGERRTDA